ncbi:hypothetical protein [Desulfovibrio sp. ZJ369]|uniref:hypothetical protein n=1 Tax=Desulfovibrio sp. ZJ369 TaxID=2709793 RepID=UPI0013ECF803|nr:hypothetical protein [Desulfovibrio sp. ZJ369]
MDDDAQNLISGNGFELCATEAFKISAQFYNTLIGGESGSVTIGFKADSVNGLRWLADMGAMCEGTAFAADLIKDFMHVENCGRLVVLNGAEIDIIGMEMERIDTLLTEIENSINTAANSLRNVNQKASVAATRQSLQSSQGRVDGSVREVTALRDELAGLHNTAGAAREEINGTGTTNACTVSEVASQSRRAETVRRRTCANTVQTAVTCNETAGSHIQE